MKIGQVAIVAAVVALPLGAGVVLSSRCAKIAEPQLPVQGESGPDGLLPDASIPYVATRYDTVADMLWMAEVDEGDVVYDLGSGDGRIVIAAVRDFGAARAVGIEKNAERIEKSQRNVLEAGVAERVELIHGDLFTTDFREASVVTLFLGHSKNFALRPKLFRLLKPGMRVVSHQFGMGEWTPDKSLEVRTVHLGMYGEAEHPFANNPHVPDYTGNEMHFGSNDRIHMWVMPAAVAGIWRGKVQTVGGMQTCEVVLHQSLSKVTGKFRLSGVPSRSGRVHVDLWGDHLRFTADSSLRSDNWIALRFDGHVRDNTLQGTLEVGEGGGRGQRSGRVGRQQKWQAEREAVDFAGTWRWPSATGGHSVGLRLERRDGHLVATYLDGDRRTPLRDVYDFGGGFYFTLLVGGATQGRTAATEDTGWLIGEAVLDRSRLVGSLGFWPYPRDGESKAPAATITRDWRPRRTHR